MGEYFIKFDADCEGDARAVFSLITENIEELAESFVFGSGYDIPVEFLLQTNKRSVIAEWERSEVEHILNLSISVEARSRIEAEQKINDALSDFSHEIDEIYIA